MQRGVAAVASGKQSFEGSVIRTNEDEEFAPIAGGLVPEQREHCARAVEPPAIFAVKFRYDGESDLFAVEPVARKRVGHAASVARVRCAGQAAAG